MISAGVQPRPIGTFASPNPAHSLDALRTGYVAARGPWPAPAAAAPRAVALAPATHDGDSEDGAPRQMSRCAAPSLLVPVIRDTDRRSLVEWHARAAELAEAARNGALTPDDMTGSTFPISNLGMFGVDEFCAIVNPGESAILAVSSVVPTPIAVGDGFRIRQIMKLTLTADHRLVDGEIAARFLNALRRMLQEADAFRGDVLNG